MTEKELKKLNRYQLLELLMIQTERADDLQARLEEAEKKLADKEIKISSLGSIAEASLQVHGVFQAAQEAADAYIAAAKKRARNLEKAAIKKSREIIEKAKEEADFLKDESNI